MKVPLQPVATIPGVRGYFRIGQILDLRQGKTLSFQTMVDRISSKDLVFIGEVHDNPAHHLIQVQILQALISRCGSLSIAVEFLEQKDQQIIEQYLQGNTTENEFLKKSGWADQWGYPYFLYRPLFLLARERKIRVLGINAPREIVRKVARNGLKSLSPTERSRLPQNIDLTNKAHRAYLQKIFELKSHRMFNNFEYFYQAQCVWEETMARNLTTFFEESKGKLIVFAGNGHIADKFGIPERATRRYPASIVTIVPYPLEKKTLVHKKMADYLWLTEYYPHKFSRF